MTEINREGLEAARKAIPAGHGQAWVYIEAAIRAYLPFHTADAGLVEAGAEAAFRAHWPNDDWSRFTPKDPENGPSHVQAQYRAICEAVLNAVGFRLQAPAGGDGEKPVAWQHRIRLKGAAWSDWFMGRAQPVADGYECEERPLYASPPAPAAEPRVAVKPLEWPAECHRGQRVRVRVHGLFSYVIAHYGGDGSETVFRWAYEARPWSEPLATYEAAKAAAQADYEKRVLSCLVSAPAAVGEGFVDPEFARAHAARKARIAANRKEGARKAAQTRASRHTSEGEA